MECLSTLVVEIKFCETCKKQLIKLNGGKNWINKRFCNRKSFHHAKTNLMGKKIVKNTMKKEKSIIKNGI